MRAGELTARVDAIGRRVGDGTNVDEALAAEVNALADVAEGEHDLDSGEARTAASRHSASYGWLWNSGINPYNWFTDTEGRARARVNVWPLDAEAAEDQAQLTRLRGMQDNIAKHTMSVEQRELIENTRALRNQLGDDVGFALAQIIASTGMSRGDALAAHRVFRDRFDSDTSAVLVGALARVNQANQEAGVTTRLTAAQLSDTTRWFYDHANIDSENAPTLAETFYARAAAVRDAGGTVDENKLRTDVIADYRFFYALPSVGRATAGVLASLVGSPSPTRESIADHYKWFYAQSSVGESEALVMTALVAPYDGTDARDADTRRREVMADREVVNKLETPRGSLAHDSQLSALAAYRDPSIDFTHYLLLVWFYSQLFGSSASTAFAGAATQRFQRTGTTSRIGQVSTFQVRTPRTAVPIIPVRVGAATTRAPGPAAANRTATASRTAATASATANRAAATASATASRAAAQASATASRAAAQASAAASRAAAQASASAARSAAAASSSSRR